MVRYMVWERPFKSLRNRSKNIGLPGIGLAAVCLLFGGLARPALAENYFKATGTCNYEYIEDPGVIAVAVSGGGTAPLVCGLQNCSPSQYSCPAFFSGQPDFPLLSVSDQYCYDTFSSCDSVPPPGGGGGSGGAGSLFNLGGDGGTSGAGGLGNDFGSTRLTGPEQGQASFTSHATTGNKQWLEEAMRRQTAIAPLRDTPAPKTTLDYERNYLKKTAPKAPCAGVSGPCLGSLDAKPDMSLFGKKGTSVRKSPGSPPKGPPIKKPQVPPPPKENVSPQTCSSKWACGITKLSDFSHTPEYKGMAEAGGAIVSALKKTGPVGEAFATAGDAAKDAVEIGLKATDAQTRDELGRNDQLDRIKDAQHSCKAMGDTDCVKKLGKYADEIRNKEGYSSGASFVFSGVRAHAVELTKDYIADEAEKKLVKTIMPKVSVDAPITMRDALPDGISILKQVAAGVASKKASGAAKDYIKEQTKKEQENSGPE